MIIASPMTTKYSEFTAVASCVVQDSACAQFKVACAQFKVALVRENRAKNTGLPVSAITPRVTRVAHHRYCRMRVAKYCYSGLLGLSFAAVFDYPGPGESAEKFPRCP